MADLPPPHSAASERAILAAVMLEPEELDGLRARLRPEHFYFDAHQQIFEAMLSTGGEIVPVCHELRRRGLLGRVGGQRAVAELVLNDELGDALPWEAPPLDLSAHVEIVVEHWRNRKLIRVLQEATAKLYGGLPANDAWRAVKEACAEQAT